MEYETKLTHVGGSVGNTAAGANRMEGPLTVEVMSALDQAQSTANEISARLFSLRDRLFGSPPEVVNAASPSQRDSSNFKDTHADRASTLIRTLNTIDTMSNEIANRL